MKPFDHGRQRSRADGLALRTTMLVLAAAAVVVSTLGLMRLAVPPDASSSTMPSAVGAPGTEQPSGPRQSASSDAPGQVDYRSSITMEDLEEELPPVVLGDHSFTVVVHKKRLVWPAEARHKFDPDDDETAESFDVRDAEGNVLHEYGVLDDPTEIELSRVRNEGRFSFSYSVSAYLLEGSAGKALMVDWSFFPSAPSACSTHIVLGVVDGKLMPFGQPFCENLKAPRDLTAAVWRLKKQEQTGDDILEIGCRTGFFSVVIPVRVDFSSRRLLPSRRCFRMNEPAKWVELCEFPVEAQREPQPQDTFVRLFPRPDAEAVPQHVVVKPGSKVDFLSALTPNVFDAVGNWTPLPAEASPWLKVRIEGREGWVRDAEDLLALGLYAAG